MSHDVHICQTHMKYAYDLSIYTKVPNAKRSIQIQTTSKINYFHGRCSTLSASRTPFKLKLFKCSYRYHLKKTVYRGSMIQVIISEDSLLCFIVVLYVVEHYHGSLVEVNIHPIQEHFLQLLKITLT